MRDWKFPPKTGNKARMPTLAISLLPLQHAGGFWLVQSGKKNKRHLGCKQRSKLFLLADDMILYVENPKEFTHTFIN